MQYGELNLRKFRRYYFWSTFCQPGALFDMCVDPSAARLVGVLVVIESFHLDCSGLLSIHLERFHLIFHLIH